MFWHREKNSLRGQILLILFLILLSAALSHATEIDEIKQAITSRGAKWVAEENPISILPREERIKRLGAIIEEFDVGAAVNESFYAALALPSAFDWRNYNGGNYVTPVRDQGSCGSCWAFATTAALESKALITFGWPGTNLDLSEQFVLSCSGAGNCSTGGSASRASDFLRDTGANLETCYPYTATDGNCGSTCASWQSNAYKFESWSYVVSGSTATVDAIKNAIYLSGPVVAWFKFYTDFYSYKSGVYSYTTGGYEGNHFVLVVGWDDSNNAFIVKNSWGTYWGESGYFRIDYSELAGTTEFGRYTYAYGNAIRISVTDTTSSLVPYDDFSGTYIDKNKWSSWELVREIEDGKFVSETTAYGSRVSNRLNFKNPTPINYIEADVTINKIEGDLGSSGIPNYSSPNAGITGFFYNDGSASGPGSYKGEVQGAIRISPYNGMHWVYWNVWKSADDEGTSWPTLAWNWFPAPVSLNTTYKLSIQFEPSSRTFTFKVGSTTRTWTSTDTIYPSNIPWKAIGTDVYFTGTGTELYGKISATFDNVIAKDESGHIVVSDDFSSSSIDPTKWTRYEFVREISGGKLRSKTRSSSAYTSPVTNSLEFVSPTLISNIQAKVTPLIYQNTQSAYTSARLIGFFYNDGTPGGGRIGDVGAEVRIGGYGASPVAEWSVWKLTNFDGTTSVGLASGTFTTPVTLGNIYTLYIGWDGTKFIFKIGDEVAQYMPVTSILPPNFPWKAISTRIAANTNKEATIEALFDDVMVNAQLGITDFDGDGKTDIAVYHPPTGLWFIKKSSDGTSYYVGYGGPDYKPVPGDYDGDGKTDIAVYHPTSGLWFIKKSSDGTSYYVGYGGTDYRPVPGDYDGDGKTDIAVYHSPSGLWFIKKSSDGTSYYVGYGGIDYKPVPGDYDGDGKTDVAVYHSSSGLWFIKKSSDGTSYYVGYGGTDYKPVPGDYDGDGKTDIAVYHSPSGLWFIRKSSDDTSYYVGYGGTDYKPVPGDYDGDGKTDIAVYHSPSGLWFIKKSSDSTSYYVGYGGTDYHPVNLPYLMGWVY